uniref:Uncharacterized protein n=1 Tax=Amphimedon queenslandica TaxID=400682 RepID=A0A1X7UHJ4_AMPQE
MLTGQGTDSLALRTRNGGLKIFYGGPTLPTLSEPHSAIGLTDEPTACACGVVAGIIAAYAAREDTPSSRLLSAQEEEREVEEEEEDNERESGSRTGCPSLSIDIMTFMK